MEKAIDQIARINPQPTAEAGSLSCHATIQAIAKTVITKLTMDITFSVFIKFLSLNSTFTVSIHLIRIFVNRFHLKFQQDFLPVEQTPR
jgi:hypothetical protein